MKLQLRVSHHFLTSLWTLVTSPKRAGGARFITVGGSGGMATRKMAPKGRKPRMGLGSQMKVESKKDEEVAATLSEASSKHSPAQSKSINPGATSGEGMVALMRTFLDVQEQREERYLWELRGLRESIVQSIQPAETSIDMDSLRMELPTLAEPRVSTQAMPARDLDSPTVTAPSQLRQCSKLKMPVFRQGEDIENYLQRFERLARTWRWPEEDWSYQLVPLLTEQALEAYLAMDEKQVEVYADLKEALLEKFKISPETYRQRFRETSVPAGESPTETYHHLRNRFGRWVRPEEHAKACHS